MTGTWARDGRAVALPAPAAAGPGLPATGPPGEGGAETAGLAELRAQLREARETIEAIRAGGIDALLIGPPGQEEVYSVGSADRTYRLIVNAMNEGAATISPLGVILDANPRLGAMTGRIAAELVGTPVTDLVPRGHHRTFTRLLDLGVGGSARGEVDVAGPGGTAIPVLLAVSGFDLDGMLLRSLVLTDLTDQHRAEAEVQELTAGLLASVEQRTADLARSNRNLEAFTYSVSHDLRAPLRGLNGFSELLLEEYGGTLGEIGREYAERIQAASERMSALIDDLLQLSRVSRVDTNPRPVNLSAEVTGIAAELQAGEPGRRVRFVIAGGVTVTADQALIRTLLRNLLGNAWKFTSRRKDAVIEFGTTPDSGPGVCCFVRDNGAGFDPAYAGKLFQPFQRLHSAAEFPGTGIGLATVQRIVERHGGRVWAQGTVGAGATFYFILDTKDSHEGLTHEGLAHKGLAYGGPAGAAHPRARDSRSNSNAPAQ